MYCIAAGINRKAMDDAMIKLRNEKLSAGIDAANKAHKSLSDVCWEPACISHLTPTELDTVKAAMKTLGSVMNKMVSAIR